MSLDTTTSQDDAETSRTTKKGWLRAGLIVPLLLCAVLSVSLVAAVMSSIVSDQETTDIFNNAATLPPELIDSVNWLPDQEGDYRPMEPLTRTNIASSWIRAWEQLRIVAETGDTSGVDVYFANSARSGVLERSGQWDGRSIEQLGHDLQVTFYSEDGQVVGLSSAGSRLLRTDRVGEVTLTRETTETYEAVLVLEDGNWRIHHWIRRSLESGRPTTRS